ncbi:MAG: hypothetical protein J07HX5_01258 [halophilic archaeon J07HX5]|nr:MAG: hypothetical protein J07HX5_01258 [halophilic archaeon J07HX5]
MSDKHGASDKSKQTVPLQVGQAAVEAAYADANRTAEPFLAVEQYGEEYAVTYDLLPADEQLTPAATAQLQDRLTAELEAIVADTEEGPAELSKTVSDSLGNVSAFRREQTARQVAAVIADVVLKETNWR